MRNEYAVYCTYEMRHQFTDGLGIVTYDAIIIVRTKNKDRIVPLLSGWCENINIKEINLRGEIEGDEDDVAKAYDSIISVKPATD